MNTDDKELPENEEDIHNNEEDKKENKFKDLAKSGLIKKSAASVGSNIFFAMVILGVALLPIMTFQKVEGKMFSPFAWTVGFCLLGSLILSLTYVPVMCKLLLTNKPLKEKENFISKFFTTTIYKLYEFASRHRKGTIIAFCVLLLTCGVRFMFWGTEFIPKMNEGAIYIRATLPNSVNLEESVRLTKEMKLKLLEFDEIDFILTQTGRPNDGTDATGFFNIEFHIELKPESEWSRRQRSGFLSSLFARTGTDKDLLLSEIEEVLAAYPGINFTFSQPIQDNVEEYVAGVKSALVIKIFGDDIRELEALADKTAEVIKDIEGIEDVNVFRCIGLPELQIIFNEERMARYGVSMADAQAVIEMAIGGKAASKFYENERTFDIIIRFQKEHRDSKDKIENILIPTLEGKQVVLKELADIKFVTGPTFIYREGSSRYVGIGFSIRGRDLGSTIKEAQEKVNKALRIGNTTASLRGNQETTPTFAGANATPPQEGNFGAEAVPHPWRGGICCKENDGVVNGLPRIINDARSDDEIVNSNIKIEWAGEFESQQRATARLKIIIPAVILLVLFLLYMNFGNVKDTLIAASTMPYGFIAGFLSLWITGTIFGISAGIGFIILFGISAINSILLTAQMKRNLLKTRDLISSINDAVKKLLRPIIMVALMGSMGLFPASMSSGMGSEVQKPFAIMIVGGIIICMLLSFTVLPQVFYFAYKGEGRGKSRERNCKPLKK